MWDIILVIIAIGILAMVIYVISHPHQKRGDFYDTRQKNRDDALNYIGKRFRR